MPKKPFNIIGNLFLFSLFIIFSLASVSAILNDKVTEQDNLIVEFVHTYSTLTEQRFNATVRQAEVMLSSRNIDLNIIMDSLTYSTDKAQIEVNEWKQLSKEVPHYDLIEKCNTNSTICWTERVENGVDTINYYGWKSSKAQTFQKTAKEYKENMGEITIPKYNLAEIDKSIKVFQIIIKTPVEKRADGTFGTSGILKLDLEGNIFYDLTHSSWWDLSIIYKRDKTSNVTVSSCVRIPYRVNSSAGVDNSIIWASPEYCFNTTNNYSDYLYYNNWTDIYVVNGNENTQLPHDSEDSTVPSYNPYEVWKSNYIMGVWHLNSTLNAVSDYGLTITGGTSYLPAKFGFGLNFYGKNSYATTSDAVVFNSQNTTMCLWVNVTGAGYNPDNSPHSSMLGYGGNNVAGFSLNYYNNTGGQGFGMRTQAQFVNSSQVPITNQMYFVCGTYDSTKNATIFVNGTAYNSVIQTNPMTLDSTTYPLRIGVAYQGSAGAPYYYSNATYDEVRYWNRTLTSHEIKAMYEEAIKIHSELGVEVFAPPTTPAINPPSPANESRTIDNSVTLNCTAISYSGSPANIEFYVDDVLKQDTPLTEYSFATNDGQAYTYKCRANDNESYSNYTAIRTFTENTKPVLSNIILNSTDENKTTGNLTANYDYSDSEADGEADKYIKWFKNSVEQTALENNTIILAGNLSVGEVWYFKVGSYDGYEWSSEGLSNNLTIIAIVVILENPLDNQEIVESSTILLEANTLYTASSCTFYNRVLSATWYLIGTNSTAGTNFTLSYTVPYGLGRRDFRVLCTQNAEDINYNIRLVSSSTASTIADIIIDIFAIILITFLGIIFFIFLLWLYKKWRGT